MELLTVVIRNKLRYDTPNILEVVPIKPYFKKLKVQLAENPLNLGDADSVLALLYEAYNEINKLDNEQIKIDFQSLYKAMNGMSLKEMDRIIYPVCRLCRDHARFGFAEGVKVGIRLQMELTTE